MLGRFRPSRRRGSPHSVPKVILAHQGDGLGERLNALLNAMRLADLLGVDFRFTWPTGLAKDTNHAIVPPEEFFTADFIADHLVGSAEASGGFPQLGPADDIDSLHAQLAAAEQGLRVGTRPLTTRIDPEAVPAVRHGFAEEFARVGFHPAIGDAIAAARAVPLGTAPAGIHLRAGDNLFGRYRSWTRYAHKVVPVPVARALVERHRRDGRDVMIFGQDVELVAELCASTGAVNAKTLRPTATMSRPAEAMFDLVFLSRCDPIISGFSGFAIQAASIAGTAVKNHLDLIPPHEVVTITRTDLAAHGERYGPVHRAFAWWSAYYGARHELTYDEAVSLVRAALDADPTNPRSRLRLAALHYRNGHADLGDDVLVDALIDDVAVSGRALASVLLFSLRTVGGHDSLEIFDDFEHGAQAGSGVATIYRAALRAERGETDAAREDVATFQAFAAADPRLSELVGLEAKVAATMKRRIERAGRPV